MTQLLDGTKVGDIVLVNNIYPEVCRVLEIDNLSMYNVKVLSLKSGKTYDICGAIVQKLTKEVYEKEKQIHLNCIEELDNAMKLIN